MTYAFGEFELDAALYELRRRGEIVDLEPKVFDVLTYLVENHHRVVSKRELLESLWPDEVVGEWSLTRCVSRARRALGDRPSEQSAIQTVYGRGYRFVAQLADAATDGEPFAFGSTAPDERRAPPPLEGRTRELAELRSGLDAALDARGGVYLLVGEPGIGKTRLADELASLARARGAAVRVGHCWETEGAPAFWPWVQILRAEAAARDAEELKRLAGSSAADLASIVPELDHVLGRSPDPPPLEPRQERFRLFDSVTQFVRRVAREEPLLLILDDLDRADPPSLRLLEFVARDLSDARVLVVGTYRDADLNRDPERARIVGALTRDASAHHIQLRGLEPSEVARFVEACIGRSAEPVEVATLHQQTGGNPFFLTQLVPALGESPGTGACGEGASVLPQGARDAILRHLDGVSLGCRAALDVAAVIGRDFALTVLESAIGTPREHLLDALDEAVRARIVSGDPDRAGHYRFSHALVRDTLYATLNPTARAELHRAIGEALERTYGSERQLHVAELAHHFSEAPRAQNAKKALDYTIAAGDLAIQRIAYEEAIRHYTEAMELLERQEPIEEARRCDVLRFLGSAQLRSGDHLSARSTLSRAAEIASTIGPPERLAAVAVTLSSSSRPLAGDPTDDRIVELLREALRRMPVDDSALRARVLASLATASYWGESFERRCAMSLEALAIARRVGEASTLIFALSSAIVAHWDADHIDERVAMATEAVQLGEKAGLKDDLIDARVLLVGCLLELGEIRAYDREVAAISQQSMRLPQLEAGAYVPWFRAIREIMVGNFEAGERYSRQFLEHMIKRQNDSGRHAQSIQTLLLREQQGRFDEARALAVELSEQNPASQYFRCVEARILCEMDRFDDARATVDRLTPGGRVELPRNIGWLPSIAALAEACAALHDTMRAPRLYELLAPYGARHLPTGGAFYAGAAARRLGLLAALLGRREAAALHFEAALEMERRVGAEPALARTRYDYARALLAGGRPAARARARALAERSLQTARTLGMAGLESRVLSLS